jgi:mannitol-1-phosphate 5-dehydrogenase
VQLVKNVRAVHAKEIEVVVEEITSADLISTSVGKAALPKIIPTIARGILERYNRDPENVIDIIIAENLQDGAQFFTESLGKSLPVEFPIKDFIGLVETSIGKMVPIMKKEDVSKDPLWVFGESYNQLILANKGLKKRLPLSENISLVNNIQAYVDRKLYIHNLGHASAAYLGYQYMSAIEYLGEVMENNEVEKDVREAMLQSAAALRAEYPEEFSSGDLSDHVEDLIERFKNKALEDSVFRVGRDLSRKLEKSDRLMGAILLCAEHKLPYDAICRAVVAGFGFKARDENGNMFSGDEVLHQRLETEGIEGILRTVCHLDDGNALERDVIAAILAACNSRKEAAPNENH